MRSHRSGVRRLALSSLLALSALLAAPAVAPASCDDPVSRPFLAFHDAKDYRLVDGGDFETGAAGWLLEGGAAVVADNESFYVHAPGDAGALAIPAGGSATTPLVCTDPYSPVSRFFARELGDARLQVEILHDSPEGVSTSIDVGSVQAGPDWDASRRVQATTEEDLSDEAGVTWVRYRYTAVGAEVRIDDVYVDPRRR